MGKALTVLDDNTEALRETLDKAHAPILSDRAERRAAMSRVRRYLRRQKTNGVVLYEGPSQLDGAPIVVIATGLVRASNNDKTGAMVQTWILRADLEPIEASKLGEDESICGDCPHRWHTGGACYVRIGDAPTSIYRAWRRGVYPIADESLMRDIAIGFDVRAGSYGDPAAAPLEVWAILKPATGYTHQWQDERFGDLSAFLMASCDSEAEREQARVLGFRTFRVGREGTAPVDGEIFCANTTKGIQCADCQLCPGQAIRAKDIFLIVHGSRKASFKARQA